jgi:hypothetical protein
MAAPNIATVSATIGPTTSARGVFQHAGVFQLPGLGRNLRAAEIRRRGEAARPRRTPVHEQIAKMFGETKEGRRRQLFVQNGESGPQESAPNWRKPIPPAIESAIDSAGSHFPYANAP